MAEQQGSSRPVGGGLLGSLKLTAAVAILGIAGLGILTVFGFVTNENFKDLAVKVLLMSAIIGGASVVIGLLARGRK